MRSALKFWWLNLETTTYGRIGRRTITVRCFCYYMNTWWSHLPLCGHSGSWPISFLLHRDQGRANQANWTMCLCVHSPETFGSSLISLTTFRQMSQTNHWSSSTRHMLAQKHQTGTIHACYIWYMLVSPVSAHRTVVAMPFVVLLKDQETGAQNGRSWRWTRQQISYETSADGSSSGDSVPMCVAGGDIKDSVWASVWISWAISSHYLTSLDSAGKDMASNFPDDLHPDLKRWDKFPPPFAIWRTWSSVHVVVFRQCSRNPLVWLLVSCTRYVTFRMSPCNTVGNLDTLYEKAHEQKVDQWFQ